MYSVPGFRSEWFWYYLRSEKNKECVEYFAKNFPGKSYADLGPEVRSYED